MQLTFTLQSAYTGATYVAGPFNISGTTTGGTTYELATGVTKSELATGYTINTAYESITGGTIQSTGTCGTSQLYITGVDVPPDLAGSFTAYTGTTGTSGTACASLNAVTIFYKTGDPSGLNNAQTYYKANGTKVNGSTFDAISDGTIYGTMDSTGVYSNVGNCTI